MDWLIGITEGIIAALLASVISLVGLRLIKPRIELSPEIAVRWSDENGDLRYSIKLANRSRRPIIEPKFALAFLYNNSVGRQKSFGISRSATDPMSIAGRRKSSGNSEFYTATYSADIIEIIGNRTHGTLEGSLLRFRCFARDELSGIGKQFQQEYEPLLDKLVYGSFESGASLKVMQEEPHPEWLKKISGLRIPEGPADKQSEEIDDHGASALHEIPGARGGAAVHAPGSADSDLDESSQTE